MDKVSSSASSIDCGPISWLTRWKADFERHAGFDADQQQVERIGKRAADRGLPALDAVVDEEVRKLHSEPGRADADQELQGPGDVELDHQEHIDQRQDAHRDRRDEAEEQEPHIGPVPAISGFDELGARRLLPDIVRQLEFLDDGLHVLARRRAQARLFAARHAVALALADSLPFARHRRHALLELIGGEKRHREREHRRRGGDAGEHHHQQLPVFDEVDQKLEHVASFRNRS